LSAILALGLNFVYIPVAGAESLESFDVTVGENGGSFLVIDNKIVVSGGEVIISGASIKPVSISGDAKIVLKGASINSANGPAIEIASGVRVEIVLDGENELKSADKSAGIKVGYESSANMASLVISGDGSLTVTGGENGGAGIGGSGTKNIDALHGNITIESGVIAAAAQKSGAGIGGGDGIELVGADMPGKIIINGGEISAIGKDGSAGIGGGNYVGADIKVTGGVINDVMGGAYAAGIGGGKGSEVVNIDISGGELEDIRGYESTKKEGLGGAAIGTGSDIDGYSANAELNINISNGNIKKAVAGWGASGIGNGAKNESKNEVAVSDTIKLASMELEGKEMIDMDREAPRTPEPVNVAEETQDFSEVLEMVGCMVGGAVVALCLLFLIKKTIW